jgi:hypothetical protein
LTNFTTATHVLRKLATLLVRAVNSLLSHTPTCFRIGSKFRCSIEAYRNALDERERLCVFREHGCELPANSIFDRTNTRYPQAIRCMLLSSELRKPIEKSAYLAMTVRAIAYLAGQGQAMGHRRSKAVACRISRTLSSLEPPGCTCLCLRGNHQRAAEFNSMRSVPAPHATAVSGHLYTPAPPALFPLAQWQSNQEGLVDQTKSIKGDAMQNGSITRSTRSHGPDVWEFRSREGGTDGKRKHRRMVIGSIAQFSDKSSVLLEVAALRRQSI